MIPDPSPTTPYPPNTIKPQSCYPRSPPSSSALLLGHCEWLLHLDCSTIVDGDVFKRLITAICFCGLDCPHHFLDD